MPFLKIQINQDVELSQQSLILKEASALVATELAKSESYVMVHIEPSTKMIFAGSTEPAAYLELKSIDLQDAQTASLSKALCQFIHNKLDIPLERIYIEFVSATRSMWGWNGRTL